MPPSPFERRYQVPAPLRLLTSLCQTLPCLYPFFLCPSERLRGDLHAGSLSALTVVIPAELWARSALPHLIGKLPAPTCPGQRAHLPYRGYLVTGWPRPSLPAWGRVRAVPAQCGPALFPLRRSQVPDLRCAWAAVRIALLARLPGQAKEPSCSEGPAALHTSLHPPSQGVRVFSCAGVPRPLARIPSGNSLGPRLVPTGLFPIRDRPSRGAGRRGAWVLRARSFR